MSEDTTGSGAIDRAAEYARFGLRVFPVLIAPGTEGDKGPMPGYGWVALASSKLNEVVEDFDRAVQLWGEDRVGVGWALGLDGYVAIDLDLPHTEWPDWASTMSGAAALNITKRGTHLIFKNPEGMQPGNTDTKFPTQGWGEVRGFHGYIIIAGPDRPGFNLSEFDHCKEFPCPDWLEAYGGGAEAVSMAEVVEFAAAHNGTGSMPNKINGIQAACDGWDPKLEGDPKYGRHPFCVWVMTTVAEESLAGYYPFAAGLLVVKTWWHKVTPPHRHKREWNGIVTWAVGRALTKRPPTEDPAAGVDTATVDDDGITRSALVDGASWLLDEQTDTIARWGSGSEILWAQGESMMLVGPPGVGKTTLMAQIVGGLIGAFETVLGYPVRPASKVLYLAMDRPRQIQRALARTFHEQHRALLAEHLLVHRGPLLSDLGKRPDLLLEMARQAGLQAGDVIIMDSLKDAAVKLSDDEVGGNVNRAIQFCNAADLDVGVLHHQRKGQQGEKPTTLEDVYGNTWLTAGTGSVVLLWGEAGSETVELSHLKQPADPVGPLRIEHDHHHGTSRVERGFDVLTYLRAHPEGVTVAQAAQAEHAVIVSAGSAKWKRTERRLRRLVKDGLAVATGQATADDGRFGTVKYAPL